MSRQRKPSADNLCLEEGGGDNGSSGITAPLSANAARQRNHRNVVQRMRHMAAERHRNVCSSVVPPTVHKPPQSRHLRAQAA